MLPPINFCDDGGAIRVICVPDGVQIRCAPVFASKRGDFDIIASPILVVGGVQRLMQIADEVYEKLQRLGPHGVRPGMTAGESMNTDKTMVAWMYSWSRPRAT